MTTYIQEHVNALIDGLFTDCPDHGAMLDAIDQALETHRELHAEDVSERPLRDLVIYATLHEHVDVSDVDDQAITEAVEMFADHHTAGAYFDTVTSHWEPA